MGIFDFLRNSAGKQETVNDVRTGLHALSDLQQYVESYVFGENHGTWAGKANGSDLRLPGFGGKNPAETGPMSAEIEGKTLEQIGAGNRLAKTMEQYEGEYWRLQNGFERNFYDGSAGRTEKALLGKQYCQNVNAICEMRDREKTLGLNLDGVKNQMAAMHTDHPNGFSLAEQARYESLLGQRRQLELDISRLGSMEYQLEGNNRSIAGWLGERYVPVVDLPQYNKEQTVSNLEKYFGDCERKLGEGKALPRDAYLFAATHNYMKDALNDARGMDVNGSQISDERIDRALAKSEALSEAYRDTFRDHKFLPDGTYSQHTEKNRPGTEILSRHSERAGKDGKTVIKDARLAVGESAEKLDRNATTYTDSTNRIDRSKQVTGVHRTSEKQVSKEGYTSVTKTDTGLLKGNLSYSADLQAKKAAVAADAAVLENSFRHDRETDHSEYHIKGENRLGYADVSAEGSAADLKTGRLRVSAEQDLAKGNINLSGGSKEKDGLTFEASAAYAAGQKKAGADIDAAKLKAHITNSEKDITAEFHADVKPVAEPLDYQTGFKGFSEQAGQYEQDNQSEESEGEVAEEQEATEEKETPEEQKTTEEEEHPEEQEATEEDEHPEEQKTTEEDEHPEEQETTEEEETPEEQEATEEDEHPEEQETTEEEEHPEEQETMEENETPEEQETTEEDETPEEQETSEEDESTAENESSGEEDNSEQPEDEKNDESSGEESGYDYGGYGY